MQLFNSWALPSPSTRSTRLLKGYSITTTRDMRIATLANEFAIPDLDLFFYTLSLWNPELPDVYLYCDTKVSAWLAKGKRYAGKLFTKEALNLYTGLSRRQMEQMPGDTCRTLFGDFTAEKTNLLEWAFSYDGTDGVLFCDTDICFLGPLPKVPGGKTLAVSPHMIRSTDTALYGIYNAGFIWMKDVSTATRWRELCKTSRFFEQACIEDLVAETPTTYEYPIQVNYGWWRLWQADTTVIERSEEWASSKEAVTVQGLPLLSVHTHFYEKNDKATVDFNRWVFSWLKKQKKAAALVQKLTRDVGLSL